MSSNHSLKPAPLHAANDGYRVASCLTEKSFLAGGSHSSPTTSIG